MKSKLRFEAKAFTLNCSFVIIVASFTGLRHDDTQVGYHQKQKKSNDQGAPVIRCKEIKALPSLDIKLYLVT